MPTCMLSQMHCSIARVPWGNDEVCLLLATHLNDHLEHMKLAVKLVKLLNKRSRKVHWQLLAPPHSKTLTPHCMSNIPDCSA